MCFFSYSRCHDADPKCGPDSKTSTTVLIKPCNRNIVWQFQAKESIAMSLFSVLMNFWPSQKKKNVIIQWAFFPPRFTRWHFYTRWLSPSWVSMFSLTTVSPLAFSISAWWFRQVSPWVIFLPQNQKHCTSEKCMFSAARQDSAHKKAQSMPFIFMCLLVTVEMKEWTSCCCYMKKLLPDKRAFVVIKATFKRWSETTHLYVHIHTSCV